MPRFAFRIEYGGGPFAGWQRQADHPSVQGVIEEALSRIDPAAPSLFAAGRTDAGVHALGQVAHADLSRDWDVFRLSEALNYHLKPHPVAVTAAAPVDDDWHARFSAVERHYLYRIAIRRAPLVHDRGRLWQVRGHLDIDAMRKAARHLVGHHDFTTFRSSECQAKSPLKTLDEITLDPCDYPAGSELRVRLRARSFLHNQVRSIVGTLERVGAGAWTADRVTQALAARDRAECGPVAPPWGLYLDKVVYPRDPFDGGA